ncbi:MAG: 50S ribosomal protein L32 [Herpetosiphon sp.]|nr:50S ribosomal protein L32 [Herpetosiphon sp.]
MGALPRRKITRQQRGYRRQHLALTPPSLSLCPNCGEYRRPHRVCLNCGTYKGRQYLKKGNNDE